MSDEVTDLPAVLVDELAPAEQRALTDLTDGEGVPLEAFVVTPDGPVIVSLDADRRDDAVAAVRLLDAQASVEAADVSTPVRTAGYIDLQYGNDLVRAPQARTEVGAAALGDVVVAVLDTGVSAHPELTGALVAGRNFTDSPGGALDTDDLHGHGTHVAGTIGADAGTDVEGVAAGVRIMPVKVLGDSGRGWSTWTADGIVWAADNGADVINMSLGGAGQSSVQTQAVAYARSKGVTVIAAAGNDNVSTPFYPAADPGVIGVAAVDDTTQRAYFSNYGSYVDVAAPGVGILSTYPPALGSYVFMSGTSMATPHVAGVAALVEAAAPGLTPDQVEQVLTTTAGDLGAPGRDDLYGHGLVDAVRSVSSARALAGGATPPANRAPVAGADAFSLPHEPGTHTLEVLGNDTDADADALTIVSATQGAYGSVTSTATTLAYTPTQPGPFVDTVTYTVSDGHGATAVGTVTVTVAGPPAPPAPTPPAPTPPAPTPPSPPTVPAPPAPVVSAPSAPRIGSPTALSGGVRVSWTAPANTGGAAITSYRVTAYRGATPARSVVVSGSTVSTTVTGLTNGTAYRLGVAAINAAGSGVSSTLVTATPRTTPGAPKIGTVTAQKKAAVVRWAKPASDGGTPVTGYVVQVYYGRTLVKTVNAGATKTSATVGGLKTGTAYTFRVVAKNAAGTGAVSAGKATRPR